MSTATLSTSAPALGEFRRGWRILVLALMGAATTVSVTLLYGFGALVVPLEQAFGWNRGDLQVAISFMSGGVVVASQLAGWLNLRWGLRRVTLVSLLALVLAFLALTLMGRSIAWLYLGFFLVPIAGAGVTFVSWTQLVSQWFEHRRGTALALVLCGSGLAAALLPSSLTWVIGRWDWRAGFVLLGLLPLVLTLPLAWRFLVASPHASGTAEARQAVRRVTSATFKANVRSRPFWVLNLALTVVVSAVVGMVTNTVPLLRDMGLSAAQASAVFSSFGIALISGRLLAGWLIDRLWAPGVAAVTLAMPSIGCLLLWSADASWSPTMLALAVALVGVGAGAEFDLSAYLVSRYFHLQDYGRLFGIHLGLITAGSMVAPLLFAVMYKSTGSYAPMLAYCTACCVLGPLLLLTLGRPPAAVTLGTRVSSATVPDAP
jgi:MFS family permease